MGVNRQAKNHDAERGATEIRVRAERRLGELLKEMPKAEGIRLSGKDDFGDIAEPPKDDAPKTLEQN